MYRRGWPRANLSCSLIDKRQHRLTAHHQCQMTLAAQFKTSLRRQRRQMMPFAAGVSDEVRIAGIRMARGFHTSHMILIQASHASQFNKMHYL